jgi:hypothetical protein
MLKKQHDQIEQLQHKAYLYKSHQKNFKVWPGENYGCTISTIKTLYETFSCQIYSIWKANIIFDTKTWSRGKIRKAARLQYHVVDMYILKS